MNIEYIVKLTINLFFFYVVCDLACYPLRVNTLAKWMLVTPRGSILLDSGFMPPVIWARDDKND